MHITKCTANIFVDLQIWICRNGSGGGGGGGVACSDCLRLMHDGGDEWCRLAINESALTFTNESSYTKIRKETKSGSRET